jgi:hypothetical protein
MNHAYDYCKTPELVTKKQLLNALHECLMQLSAAQSGKQESLDHKPAIGRASECLKLAGHIGFTP